MRRLIPIALTIALFAARTAFAAVALDANMTGGNGTGTYAGKYMFTSSGSPLASSSAITVGASATCLVVTVAFYDASANFAGLGVTWNGVSMTQAAQKINGDYEITAFVLTNPAAGANALSVSWSDAAAQVYVGATSFTGTDTSTCVKSADTVTGTTGSIAVNTGASDATLAATISSSGQATVGNFNILWAANPLGPGGGANYELGGSGSNTHTFTNTTGTVATLGIHIIAPTSPPAVVPSQFFLSRNIRSTRALSREPRQQPAHS